MTLQSLSPVLARYDPFGVDVPLNFDNTHSHNIFVDEQNGFRPGSSCTDHVFSMSALVRNRLNENKRTFAAFMDMEKAFDWIGRHLLFFKLQCHNVTGKFYDAVVLLCYNKVSCVLLIQHSTLSFNTLSGRSKAGRCPIPNPILDFY